MNQGRVFGVGERSVSKSIELDIQNFRCCLQTGAVFQSEGPLKNNRHRSIERPNGLANPFDLHAFAEIDTSSPQVQQGTPLGSNSSKQHRVPL